MKHVFLPEQASNEKKFIPLRPENQGKKIKHEAYYHGFNNDRKHIIGMRIMRYPLWLLNRKVKKALYFKLF